MQDLMCEDDKHVNYGIFSIHSGKRIFKIVVKYICNIKELFYSEHYSLPFVDWVCRDDQLLIIENLAYLFYFGC